MKNEDGTLVDRIWIKIKNNRFLAVIIVLGIVISSISAFSDSLMNIYKTVDEQIEDKEITRVVDPGKIKSSSTVDNYFSTNFEIAEKEESDIYNVSKDKISIDFSINNTDGGLKYTMKGSDNRIIINPYNKYLQKLKTGDPISPIDHLNLPFEFQLPTLDFKIANNSAETILFSKAVFKVSKSKPDNFPIISIDKGYEMNFPIRNLGWGKVFNCVVSFNLEPTDTPTDFERDFKHELSIEDFEVYADNTDLSSFYKKSGVNTDILYSGYSFVEQGPNGSIYTIIDKAGNSRKITEAEYKKRIIEPRGPFKNGISKIYGEMEYEGINISGELRKKTLKFEGTIELGEKRMSMAGPLLPSFVSELSLEANKKSYEKEISLSQELKPNEVDRFNFKLSAPQSSRHQFDLILFYNETKTFTIPNISLNYFMPSIDSFSITDIQSLEGD